MCSVKKVQSLRTIFREACDQSPTSPTHNGMEPLTGITLMANEQKIFEIAINFPPKKIIIDKE